MVACSSGRSNVGGSSGSSSGGSVKRLRRTMPIVMDDAVSVDGDAGVKLEMVVAAPPL